MLPKALVTTLLMVVITLRLDRDTSIANTSYKRITIRDS
jgi:hypothetical protein